MSSAATASDAASLLIDAIAQEAHQGLRSRPKTLSPWLFYDETGSHLFEQITELPEYYLTRTERSILAAHADAILTEAAGDSPLTLLELGAGTATKTGLLLAAAIRRQQTVLYQPIDVSRTALEEASALESALPGVRVNAQVANYITEPIRLQRPEHTRVLALYIGSSIGNFSPAEARGILRNLRSQLQPGDSLLLGTDLAPGLRKTVGTLVSAYDDHAGVTAAFNCNVLHRLNRDLNTNFRPECFAHRARWNAAASRIEMHLESLMPQTVSLPETSVTSTLTIHFAAGETIHTENSYKFTAAAIASLLDDSGYRRTRTWHDSANLFAVTLAHVK